MDLYVSNYTNRLDAKGRVSIPAPFRAALARDGFEGLYVHPSLDQEALDCGGHALLREIEGLLSGYPPYSEERDLLSLALMGSSEILKVDSEGRAVLTETLKSYAGISGEVTFVGVGHKFQIWESGRFRARMGEARTRAREAIRQPGARTAAPDAPPLRSHGARE